MIKKNKYKYSIFIYTYTSSKGFFLSKNIKQGFESFCLYVWQFFMIIYIFLFFFLIIQNAKLNWIFLVECFFSSNKYNVIIKTYLFNQKNKNNQFLYIFVYSYMYI